MQLKNLPSNLVKYSYRAILWRGNSFPFLSGDVFSDNADFAFYSPKFRKLGRRDISSAQVVFCPSHFYEQFIAEFSSITRPKILILGNSDRDFVEPLPGLPASVRKVFCQNLLFEDPRYSVLPIGIENSRLATNGVLSLYDSKYNEREKDNRILLGPFSPTHPERIEIESNNYNSEIVVRRKDRFTPAEYAEISSSFLFNACPRGNGQDTHRFWETLYRGGIPITKKNQWTTSIGNLGIPILETNNWSEDSLREVVEGTKATSQVSPLNIPQLWWPWWERRFKQLI